MRMVSEAPTMTNAPSITPMVSHSPTDLGNKGTFRLRMHWQPGYLWQELPEEDWFCVACAVCDPRPRPLVHTKDARLRIHHEDGIPATHVGQHQIIFPVLVVQVNRIPRAYMTTVLIRVSL